MNLNSPLSDVKAERLIAILGLSPTSRVVDFGCGDGEFLHRLHRATGATCLALAICMGAAHAFCEGEAAFRSALESMMRVLKPQGLIMVG